MHGQVLIKAILIVAFLAFAAFLMLPGKGMRHAAIRRLVLVAMFFLTVLAVIFPALLNSLAHFMDVGRGADLLLYGLIIVFVGNALVQQRRLRQLQREITLLARRQAIAEARLPAQDAA